MRVIQHIIVYYVWESEDGMGSIIMHAPITTDRKTVRNVKMLEQRTRTGGFSLSHVTVFNGVTGFVLYCTSITRRIHKLRQREPYQRKIRSKKWQTITCHPSGLEGSTSVARLMCFLASAAASSSSQRSVMKSSARATWAVDSSALVSSDEGRVFSNSIP